MTLEQLKNSPTMLAHLRDVMKDSLMQDALTALLMHALPSRARQQEALLGAHPDTALAHSAKYWAGWADAIQTLRTLPDGIAAVQEDSQEEEEYAHTLPESLQRIRIKR